MLSTQTSFAHTIVGTPYYLSPELCSDKPYDDKSDMWAFGVVLYECLTGRPPFQGATAMDVLFQVAGDEPTPPEPKVIGSLLFLASAMNSLKVFGGNDGCTTINSGV